MRYRSWPANLRHLIWGHLTVIRVCIAALLLLLSTQVFAEVPRAVSLLYFRGSGLDRAVSLEWATASELNTAGYRLERADASEGPFRNLSQIGIVPAIGDSLQGAEYKATDRDSLQNGNVYYYRLIEIEFDGTENPVGPISVTAGKAEPTATSVLESTVQATSTSTGGAATTASATPSPTPAGNTATPGSSLATVDSRSAGAATSASLTPPAQAQVAAVLAQNTPPSSGTAYPGAPGATLVPPAGTPGINQAYPPSGSEATTQPTEPYPLSFERDDGARTEQQPVAIPTGTLAALIGEASGAAPVQEPEPALETRASSTLLLWAGFLAALMIFVLAVVGSIIYFRR